MHTVFWLNLIERCFSSCRRLSSRSSPPALVYTENVQRVSPNFCGDLSELASLVHGTNILESNLCLWFGAQDFHLPVSSFLSAFTTAIHTSLWRLWKAFAHSCSWCFCHCFPNKTIVYSSGLLTLSQTPYLARRTGMHTSSGPSPRDHLFGLVGPARSIRLLPA